MLEKEFKDDPDKLVSSVCKFDSATGSLSYCGTICLQMTEEAVLRPTEEFFAMILYNSDPKSKVFLRRCSLVNHCNNRTSFVISDHFELL